MRGKQALVTGATNGIGKQAALELAKLGAGVVIVGRDEIKTRKVCIDIKTLSGNTNVNLLIADLSSMEDIRRVAHEYRSKYSRLDILLNNAGATFETYQKSADGYEMTFALNHFSYYLLTNLLLDILQDTAGQAGEARIVNVSSSAHQNGALRNGLRLDALQEQTGFRAFQRYAASKLANLLFTYELARRLSGRNVTVNALHPGFVNTGIGDNMTGLLPYVFRAIKVVAGRSPEKGAETLVYLAASDEVAGISGKYWVDKKQMRSSEISYDAAQQKALWEYSARATGVG